MGLPLTKDALMWNPFKKSSTPAVDGQTTLDTDQNAPAGCEHVEENNPPCQECAPALAPPPMMDYRLTFQNGRNTSGVGVVRFMGDGIVRIQEDENKVVVFDLRACMYITLEQHRVIQKPKLVVPSDISKKS
jgi:hypothetical protein